MTGTSAMSSTSKYASTSPEFVSGAVVLYVTDDVKSDQSLHELEENGEKIEGITSVQSRRDHVEHGRVHVSVNNPITGCIITGSNEDRISLSHGNSEEGYRGFLNVSL